MSSGDYYTPGTYTRDTSARAERVQADLNNIATGFGRLPDLAILRRVVQDAVTAGGTANALTLATTYTVSAYAVGQRISFKAAANNTGAATINVNSLGAKALVRQGGDALEADDLVSGRFYDAIYDGTSFQVLGSMSGEVAAYLAAAEAAKVAAEAARDAAQTARTGAETAETNAETAETNAETAQGLAEDARDAAIVAQLAAEAASLPNQTGHAGKALITNGTNASWGSLGWEVLGTISAASLNGQTSVSFTGIDSATYPRLLMVGSVTPGASATVSIAVNDGTDTETIVAPTSIATAAGVGLLIDKAGSAYPHCQGSAWTTGGNGGSETRVPLTVSPVTRINVTTTSAFNNAGGLTLYGAR